MLNILIFRLNEKKISLFVRLVSTPIFPSARRATFLLLGAHLFFQRPPAVHSCILMTINISSFKSKLTTKLSRTKSTVDAPWIFGALLWASYQSYWADGWTKYNRYKKINKFNNMYNKLMIEIVFRDRRRQVSSPARLLRRNDQPTVRPTETDWGLIGKLYFQ